jgi:hypothetical protein
MAKWRVAIVFELDDAEDEDDAWTKTDDWVATDMEDYEHWTYHGVITMPNQRHEIDQLGPQEEDD